jgi:glucose-1-phosphate cytidylyltransferase
MLTYGDGVADIDLTALLAFHRAHGRLATVIGVRPPARFGAMVLADRRVIDFEEKPQTGEGWMNGGFFVFEAGMLAYLDDDATVLEGAPLEQLARDGQLMAFEHQGYWQCMDTVRDRDTLNEFCASGRAPWMG